MPPLPPLEKSLVLFITNVNHMAYTEIKNFLANEVQEIIVKPHYE